MNTNTESKRSEYKVGAGLWPLTRQGLADAWTLGNDRHTEGDIRVEKAEGKQPQEAASGSRVSNYAW